VGYDQRPTEGDSRLRDTREQHQQATDVRAPQSWLGLCRKTLYFGSLHQPLVRLAGFQGRFANGNGGNVKGKGEGMGENLEMFRSSQCLGLTQMWSTVYDRGAIEH